ncbi:MAG: UDP-N-acetylmuramate:L-alanyl-gamma-D-glutamyl-meso-diaminopimelate ligase [Gammaproteobacteria bacterium]
MNDSGAQRIHILGIGGTFMAGIARLAVELGWQVSGSDQALYPPMSVQLAALGITVSDGYDPACLDPAPDVVVIGNALSRGNPAVEYVLDHDLPYESGPAWLARHVLRGRHVMAVAGTHGKTTVSGLLTWMLEHAGLEPGFLVGGLLENFGVSARLGISPYFVVEADEYDTAFFDKRSKFVHYRPHTLIINNLEYDHADIFPDLKAIQGQFHQLIRTLPRRAAIIRAQPAAAIDETLALGCWSQTESFGESQECDWRMAWRDGEQRQITVKSRECGAATVPMPLCGAHNAWNITAATAAAAHAGVPPAKALAALASFASVKRRLELRGVPRGIHVYDDFAHHPTAIAATIAALRGAQPQGRIIAVLEPRSNTMRLGIHRESLAAALAGATRAAIRVPDDLAWDIAAVMADQPHIELFDSTSRLIEALAREARPGDHILVMSNGAFDNIHERLLERLDHDD